MKPTDLIRWSYSWILYQEMTENFHTIVLLKKNMIVSQDFPDYCYLPVYKISGLYQSTREVYIATRGYNGQYGFSEIKSLVFQALSSLTSLKCRNIGFIGTVADLPDEEGERKTIEYVKEWLVDNESLVDSITLVDLRDAYRKHFDN